MANFQITTTDFTVLIVYVLGTRLLFGWYLARKRLRATSEEYFLAGRNLTWPIIGFSFYVSNMSASTFVGLPASGYLQGVAVYHYEWLPALILIGFALWFLPSFLRARVFTAPGFLQRRYDARSKLVFSGFLLLANVFIDAAAALYAGGMIVNVLFPGIPLWQTALVISLLAGLYIYFGGLDAVVLNDALQAFMILAGSISIALLAWSQIPSWDTVVNGLPPEHLHLIRSAGDAFLPWPGIVSGVLIVGIYFWCTNQFIIQRALGARNLDHARWGALFAGALKLPNLFLLILPGVMATALYPDLDNPDLVFPTLAFDVLPVGLRGLMLAALAAAILSSLESIYNSAATLFTMDFVTTFRPAIEDRKLVVIGRLATLVFMVLAALWAPQIERFPSLWQYLQSILSYLTPPVVAVFGAGLLWRGATATAAFTTLLIGIPLGIIGWLGNEIGGWMTIHYLYACGLLFLFNLGLMVGLSLLIPQSIDESAATLVWDRSQWQAETRHLAIGAWYRNYRYLATLLLILIGLILVWWW
ncbi:MAG: sodium/solute symporter [Gammaproteobacteria bacterium]|nr:sodium/solute symporter [Pseudomonadales bacterium]